MIAEAALVPPNTSHGPRLVRVVHPDSGVGVGVRGNIGDSSLRAASVGLPGRLRLVGATAAAAADQAVSVALRAPSVSWLSVVPPTAVTSGGGRGTQHRSRCRRPRSSQHPGGRSSGARSRFRPRTRLRRSCCSRRPRPRLTASLTAVPRSANELEFASTSTMWQFGQIALTMSRSSEISSPSPCSPEGSVDAAGLVHLVKQPLAVVQAGETEIRPVGGQSRRSDRRRRRRSRPSRPSRRWRRARCRPTADTKGRRRHCRLRSPRRVGRPSWIGLCAARSGVGTDVGETLRGPRATTSLQRFSNCWPSAKCLR